MSKQAMRVKITGIGGREKSSSDCLDGRENRSSGVFAMFQMGPRVKRRLISFHELLVFNRIGL